MNSTPQLSELCASRLGTSHSLLEISVSQDGAQFLDCLKRFHQATFGRLPERVQSFPPKLCGVPVDLQCLLHMASEKGGLDRLLRDRQWRGLWDEYLKRLHGEASQACSRTRPLRREEGVLLECILCLYPYEQKVLLGRSAWMDEASLSALLTGAEPGAVAAKPKLVRQSTSSSSSSSSSACTGAELVTEDCSKIGGLPSSPDSGVGTWRSHSPSEELGSTVVTEKTCVADSHDKVGDEGHSAEGRQALAKSDKPHSRSASPAAYSKCSVGVSLESSEITEDLLLLCGSSSRRRRASRAAEAQSDRRKVRRQQRAGDAENKCGAGENHPQSRRDVMAACTMALLRLRNHQFGGQLSSPHGQHSGASRLDLTSIQKRLGCGFYSHPVVFADDVRSVLRSAVACGGASDLSASQFKSEALELWRIFEADVAHYGIAAPIPVPASEVPADKGSPAHTPSEAKGTLRSRSPSPLLSCGSGGEVFQDYSVPWSVAASVVTSVQCSADLDGSEHELEAGELSRKGSDQDESSMVCARVSGHARRPRTRGSQGRKRKADEEGPDLLRGHSCTLELGMLETAPAPKAEGMEVEGGAGETVEEPFQAPHAGPLASSAEELEAVEVLAGLLESSRAKWCTTVEEHPTPEMADDGAAASLLASLASREVESISVQECVGQGAGAQPHVHTAPKRGHPSLTALLVHKLMKRAGAPDTSDPHDGVLTDGDSPSASPNSCCSSAGTSFHRTRASSRGARSARTHHAAEQVQQRSLGLAKAGTGQVSPPVDEDTEIKVPVELPPLVDACAAGSPGIAARTSGEWSCRSGPSVVEAAGEGSGADSSNASAARVRGFEWDRRTRPRRVLPEGTLRPGAPHMPVFVFGMSFGGPAPPFSPACSREQSPVPDLLTSAASGEAWPLGPSIGVDSLTAAQDHKALTPQPTGGSARTSLPFCWASQGARPRRAWRSVSVPMPDKAQSTAARCAFPFLSKAVSLPSGGKGSPTGNGGALPVGSSHSGMALQVQCASRAAVPISTCSRGRAWIAPMEGSASSKDSTLCGEMMGKTVRASTPHVPVSALTPGGSPAAPPAPAEACRQQSSTGA